MQVSEEQWVPYTALADAPVDFVREVLGGEPWLRQAEILEALRDEGRVTVRSAHGVGKTWVAACASLWFLYTRLPVAVLTTAPTHRQVREILWREIRRLHRQSRKRGRALPGKCLETALRVNEDCFALGLSTDEADRFQGFHALHVLVVVDEAAGVPEEIYEAIDGVLTTDDARLLLIGNPTHAHGRFYQSHRQPGWRKFVISALDCPNLQGVNLDDLTTDPDPTPRPGLVTARWVRERRAEWGEDSLLYQTRVLGNFPEQEEDALIPLAWIEAAVTRGSRKLSERVAPGCEGLVEMGVDLARFGTCESVAYVRQGPDVVAAAYWRKEDLMQSTGRVAELIRRYRPAWVKVDAVGVGAGVADRLHELGHTGVLEVNGGRAASDPERFAWLRDELYFALRDRFRDGAISLPEDDRLVAQLAALRYSYTSRGQQRVESKDEMRERGLPSPDRADALALCFAPAHAVPVPLARAGRTR
ncbi:MAG: hypothetical protein HY320_16545 [Armatimonadetes bacterium]|nr:hypothetical protein [Armatimonadota bacterium]